MQSHKCAFHESLPVQCLWQGILESHAVLPWSLEHDGEARPSSSSYMCFFLQTLNETCNRFDLVTLDTVRLSNLVHNGSAKCSCEHGFATSQGSDKLAVCTSTLLSLRVHHISSSKATWEVVASQM